MSESTLVKMPHCWKSHVTADIFFAVLKPEDKEPTVFIDLRNFDQIRHEQQQSIEKVQKVLGINPNERLVLVFHFNLIILFLLRSMELFIILIHVQ